MDGDALLSSNVMFCAGVSLLCLLYLYQRRAASWRVVPKGIPWVPSDLMVNGMPADSYAQVRAHLRDLRSGTELVSEGYDLYSKRDKPFIVPSFVTWQPEVVIPANYIPWMLENDAALSIDKCLIKDLEFTYTAPAAWSFTRPFHVEAINKLRLEALVDDMADEVKLAIDEEWGVDVDDWNEINIEETMHHVLARISTRVFFGKILCRNKEFAIAAANFMSTVSVRAVLISLVPEIFRPLAAWYLTCDLRRWTHTCANHMTPHIKQSMQESCEGKGQPKTLLGHLSRLADRSDDKKDKDPFSLSSRLLALNFVAVHTSVYSLVNALVDISSPPATIEGTWEELGVEASEILGLHGGRWSKAAIGQLTKIDSAIRESMRKNSFKARGVERIVIRKGGLVLPSGEHLPEGTKIGVPVLPIHRDPDIYDDASTYHALRFCTPQNSTERCRGRAESPGHGGHSELVNTSSSFLAFGHGRHACPGRFLAAIELKLIIAYVAMNYDIAALEQRPENAKFSDFSVGNMHCLRVRWKKAWSN